MAPNVHRDGAEAIAAWVEDYKAVIYSLITLRQLGDIAAAAVEAVLDVAPVRSFTASLALWEAIVLADRADPDALLESVMPRALIDNVNVAFGRPAMVLRLVSA